MAGHRAGRGTRGHRCGLVPHARRPGRRPGHTFDARDRRCHPGGRPGLLEASVPGHRRDRGTPRGADLLHGHQGGQDRAARLPDHLRRPRGPRPQLLAGRDLPGHLLPGGRGLLGAHRLHRHEPGRARQRADSRRRPERHDARCPPCRLPHRGDHRDALRRAGAARRHHHRVHLPELRHGRAGGLRLRRVAAGAVHAGGGRHLHQGRRRRSGPGRQGRGGHPRGRPSQRRHHRGQRGRQRWRLRGDGGGPFRVLRDHHHLLAHPRLRGLPDHPLEPHPGRDLPPDHPGLRHRRLRGRRVPGAGHRPRPDRRWPRSTGATGRRPS